MTVRRGAVSRGSRWLAVALAAVFVCSAAGAALASSGAEITSREGQAGQMLVARNGHTLYLFNRDWRKSYCYGTCAATWKPDITYGRPTTPSGSGLNAKLLGTTRRTNRSLQVTYNGHPLYLYAGDKSAGNMHGEAKYQFRGYWYAVTPSGKALKPFNPGTY